MKRVNIKVERWVLRTHMSPRIFLLSRIEIFLIVFVKRPDRPVTRNHGITHRKEHLTEYFFYIENSKQFYKFVDVLPASAAAAAASSNNNNNGVRCVSLTDCCASGTDNDCLCINSL